MVRSWTHEVRLNDQHLFVCVCCGQPFCLVSFRLLMAHHRLLHCVATSISPTTKQPRCEPGLSPLSPPPHPLSGVDMQERTRQMKLNMNKYKHGAGSDSRLEQDYNKVSGCVCVVGSRACIQVHDHIY